MAILTHVERKALRSTAGRLVSVYWTTLNPPKEAVCCYRVDTRRKHPQIAIDVNLWVALDAADRLFYITEIGKEVRQ